MLFRLTLGPRQPIRAFGSHHRRDFAFGDRVLILRAAGNQKTEGEEEALHFDIIAHMSHVVRAFALFVAAAIVLPAQSLTTVYEFNGLTMAQFTNSLLVAPCRRRSTASAPRQGVRTARTRQGE